MEGIRLEFKKDFPSNYKVAKEIAAFANTHGGILLIGCDEEDRKVKAPICGTDYIEDLHEKVSSIAFKAIYPPVFPEVQVCRLEDDSTKAVIAVRINESNDTPHRIDQDTKVYVRVASQSEPVLAKSGEIEFLQNRRKKAVETRDWLLSRAHERFARKYGLTATRGISIVPLYPNKELVNFSKLLEVVQTSRIPYYDTNFPINYSPITLQNSVLYSKSIPRTSPCSFMANIHSEINSYGLIFHKEKLIEDGLEEVNQIDPNITLLNMLVALLFARKLYETLGYKGLIQLQVFHENIIGRALTVNSSYINEFDNKISIRRETSVSALIDRLDDIILDLYREFYWSFNGEPIARNDVELMRQIAWCKREVSYDS